MNPFEGKTYNVDVTMPSILVLASVYHLAFSRLCLLLQL